MHTNEKQINKIDCGNSEENAQKMNWDKSG